MHSGADRVDKTFRRVRGKINRDGGLGRNRPGDFNVQQHFAIGSIRIACRIISAAIDGHRGDLRTTGAEISVEITLAEPSAQFNYRNTLSLPRIGGRRERIEFGQLLRRVVKRRIGMRIQFRPQAQLWFRDWTVIQTVDTDDGVDQVFRHVQCSGPAAIGYTVRLFIKLKISLERETDVARIPRQINRLLGLIDTAHRKIVFARKLFKLFDSRVLDLVCVLEFFA